MHKTTNTQSGKITIELSLYDILHDEMNGEFVHKDVWENYQKILAKKNFETESLKFD